MRRTRLASADSVSAYEQALSQLATITSDIGYHPSGHWRLRRRARR
ncbi:hypothetical protein [Amycolatopsis taiwanensis]|nr:hypothetical protein [Amycolatopsis taiwanensis]